jgi:hypothetical protein
MNGSWVSFLDCNMKEFESMELSSNLEVKYLGMSLLGCHEPNENDIDNSMDSNSFMLQSKNETQLPFICEECNKGFTLFSAYSAHVHYE